jgi:hypothetical protein
MEAVTRTVITMYAPGLSEKINYDKPHLEQSATESRFETETAER